MLCPFATKKLELNGPAWSWRHVVAGCQADLQLALQQGGCAALPKAFVPVAVPQATAVQGTAFAIGWVVGERKAQGSQGLRIVNRRGIGTLLAG